MGRAGTTPETSNDPSKDRAATHSIEVDVAVLGGGGGAETLAEELAESDLRVVVIEEDRVGGDCPFLACMPSKAMLHDSHRSMRWDDAVERRADITEQLDDRRHARQLEETGAQLLRGRGRLIDATTIAVGDARVHTKHIVLATGSAPTIPDIDGIDDIDEFLWTSDDALTATDRPARLLVIGGGPIGCELALLYAGFDTEVRLIDVAERAFPDLPASIGQIVDSGLRASGVSVCRGLQAVRFEPRGSNVLTELDNGATVMTDRVLIATGRGPNTTDIGLEHIGLEAADPLDVDECGRVACTGSVWAIGDVVGRAQYTHLANHHARVVANHLAGDASRRFDEVVTPACIFTSPPMITIGPTPDEIDGVVWVEALLSDVARWTTDSLGDGFLTVAFDPTTRCPVAAHGVGARFDELSAALVMAIDNKVPVDMLQRSMWAFPSISEILGLVATRAVAALDAA